MTVTDRLINELASEWASNPTDIRLPRAYSSSYSNSEAEYSGGFLRSIRNYLGQKAGTYLTLGALGLAAAGELACGDKNPTGPSTTDMCPNIAGEQPSIPPNMVKDGNGNCVCGPGYVTDSSGSCVVQPRSSMSISRPANGEKAATPLDIRYSYSDQTGRATHADFMVNGEAYHDRSLDGEFQIPEERAPGMRAINAGSHRLAGYLADDSEAKLEGSDSSINFEVLSISGNITDRIAGGGISGSTITWSGPVTKSAAVNGSYTIEGLPPGNYQVTISGGGHVQHKNLSVPVSVSESFPFSVLKWNSGRPGIPGVVYDQKFDGFYNLFARASDPVVKWVLESVKPTEVYVTLDGLSQPAAEEFKAILDEVKNESTSDVYCGEVGPLPIRYGPSIGFFRNATIVVDFSDDITKKTGTSYDFTTLFVIKSVHITYFIDDLDDTIGNVTTRERKKNHTAHEWLHGNGASHAFNTYRDSLQGGWADITRLSKEDKLASCIMLHPDTHPANRRPDTNPRWAYK